VEAQASCSERGGARLRSQQGGVRSCSEQGGRSKREGKVEVEVENLLCGYYNNNNNEIKIMMRIEICNMIRTLIFLQIY